MSGVLIMKKTFIEIQQAYIDTVNAGIARITREAKHKADAELAKLGFAAAEREHIIKDARDMAVLERNADA